MTRDGVSDRRFRLAALVVLQQYDDHPYAQTGVLGDATLLRRLPILAGLRRAVRALGYAFAPVDRIAGVHSMFPLLELTEILRQRIIPFRHTQNAALRILDSTSGFAMTPRLFRDICVSNYLSHESAHALFYETAMAADGPLSDAMRVETLLTSEAFAMAIDQFVALLAAADGRRSTAILLAANAYVVPADLVRNSLIQAADLALATRAAVERPLPTITMLAAASMIAIARPTAGKGRPGMADRLAQIASVEGLCERVLETLLAIGMRVDFEFRSVMQRNFYEYLGLGSCYRDFVSGRIEDLLKPESAFGRHVPSLSRELCADQEVVT